jgi:hypothetical protein
MSSQEDIANLNSGLAGSGVTPVRVLAIILMIAITSVFWIDSRSRL